MKNELEKRQCVRCDTWFVIVKTYVQNYCYFCENDKDDGLW